MKKILSIATSICIIAATYSCHKGNSALSGGSWIFKSTTFNASQAFFIEGALSAYTGESTPTGSISFTFFDGTQPGDTSGRNYTYPPKNHSYRLTNTLPLSAGYVYVMLTDTSVNQCYLTTNAANGTIVTVDTSASGKLIVTLPPVYAVNVPSNALLPVSISNAGSDSSLVSGTIKQTQ